MKMIHLIAGLDTIFDEIHCVFNGMETLFHTKQATPLLVDPVALYIQIKDLEHEVASENERLLVSTPSDVWHTLTFYFVTGNMKLSILLHIPVVRVDSYLTVYQYVPTPIALPNSTVNFLIDPMDDFLVDNRRTHMTSMIPGYRFWLCRRVNEGITYCLKRSYVLATERPSCLLALYAGNMLDVASLCPISKMTGSYDVAALSPRQPK